MTDLAEFAATEHGFEDVEELADTFVHLMRSFNRARARWLAEAEHNVEWTAHAVLRALRTEGPLRAGEVAEHLQFDPSTVSRQVAALVKDGLIERRADPEDGRASVLVLTEKADVVLADYQRFRVGVFAAMLADWSPGEVTDLTAKLKRFTAAYEDVSCRPVRAAKTQKGTED